MHESFESARAVTRQNAKSFYFSSFPLPREKRLAAYSIYAFCRSADDAVDSLGRVPTPEDLRPFIDLLDEAYSLKGKQTLASEFSFSTAFRETVLKYEIPRILFEDLMEGLMLDVDFKQPETTQELLKYCYHVAGCVGLVMTHVLGLRAPKWDEAKALGNAMQITNILRDVREDAGPNRKRIYFPRDLMSRHGLTETDFFNFAKPQATLDLALKIWPATQDLIKLAQGEYAKADLGIPFITQDGSRLCVELMKSTYSAILDRIDAKGAASLFERQRLSLSQKIFKIPNAYRHIYF